MEHSFKKVQIKMSVVIDCYIACVLMEKEVGV